MSVADLTPALLSPRVTPSVFWYQDQQRISSPLIGTCRSALPSAGPGRRGRLWGFGVSCRTNSAVVGQGGLIGLLTCSPGMSSLRGSPACAMPAPIDCGKATTFTARTQASTGSCRGNTSTGQKWNKAGSDFTYERGQPGEELNPDHAARLDWCWLQQAWAGVHEVLADRWTERRGDGGGSSTTTPLSGRGRIRRWCGARLRRAASVPYP